MAVMKCMRAEEYLDTEEMGDAGGRLDPAPLLGTWLNTNSASRGLVTIILTSHASALTVHAFGADDPSPRDWGEVPGAIYAKSVDSPEGMAFSALYDFGFMATHLQANVKQGVLVIASFTYFKDGSGRAPYFSREFYYQE
jgi:hypothetical protein